MVAWGKFSFVQADSEELKQEIYRLRFDVYAREFGFEKIEDHPTGLEMDEFDAHSVHFAAIDDNQDVIGTVRLVLENDKGFPIEHAVETTFVGPRPPDSRIAEISRLAVSRTFRRRAEDGRFGVESYIKKSEGGTLPDDEEQNEQQSNRKNPIIVLGLYQIMYHYSKRMGLSHWFMITETKLFHALKKYGFGFHQIGEPVEYHGIRVPYLGIIEEMEQNLHETNPDMLQLVLLGLEEEFHPKF